MIIQFMFEEEEDRLFLVVMNQEEQYSIWPKEKEVPAGWRAEGKEGLKKECLDHIENVWTNMRPLSLREKIPGAEKNKDID